MSVQELKITMGETYFPVTRFGEGKKELVIICGVSLTGLEGQGEAIAQAYAAFAKEYRVTLLDRKKLLPVGYGVEEMAEDVSAVMEALEIPSAAVYGVSQGGMIAQTLALRHPEKVEKLVLCSTACRPTPLLLETEREWERLAKEGDVVDINRSFFRLVYSPAFLKSVEELLPALEQQGTEADVRRFEVMVKALLPFDVSGEIEKIYCPALVLGDENDRVIGPEGSREIAQRLGCPIHLRREYSHAVYDECPDIKEEILRFLNG